MKKTTTLFIFILISTLNYAQYDLRPTPFFKSVIILKKGDSINGYTRLASSAFSIKFKDSLKQKRERKIKYKEVDKIITFTDSIKPREFYYKHTDENKFLRFVELIHLDTINIYLGLSIDVDLYYLNTGVDRRTMQEINDDLLFKSPRFIENRALHYPTAYNNFHNTSFSINFEIDLEIKRFDFFLEKRNQNELILIGTEGNFIYKNFKKQLPLFLKIVQA